MEETCRFLFTYGTLMKGFDNPFAEQLRNSSSFHSKGSFPGRLYRISWYPGATFDPKSLKKVHGEIYLLNDPENLLPVLDEYEDVLEDETNSLYVRKCIPISLPDESVLPCWVYLYNQPCENLEVINGGNFRPQ